jgi:hypothetical protein
MVSKISTFGVSLGRIPQTPSLNPRTLQLNQFREFDPPHSWQVAIISATVGRKLTKGIIQQRLEDL